MKSAAQSLLAVLATFFLASGTCQAEPPGVLILYSNQEATPAAILFRDALRKTVQEASQRSIRFFDEHLDVEGFSVQRYSQAQAVFLHEKYADRNIQVIVTEAVAALQFMIEFRDRILPGVPVVFGSVSKDLVEQLSLPADFVGVIRTEDATQTLSLALRLQPETRHLVVILGAADDRDRAWDARVRSAVSRLKDAPAVEYLRGLPTTAVLDRLSALSPATIVFTPMYFIDGAGQREVSTKVVERMVAASAAPIYIPYDHFLGIGVVGGYVASFEEMGRADGLSVARLLNGAAPSDIGRQLVANVPMVDWRQLRRWHIDENLLPPDTVVKFREPTAWDKFRFEISIGATVLILQAGLITALLVQRRSRRRTARMLEATQKKMELAATAAGLSTWNWDVANTASSAGAKSKRLPTKGMGDATPFELVLDATHPADREHLITAVEKSLATGEELDVEYRTVTTDGTVHWISARGRVESVKSKRLVGVAMDITERKAADLRAAEDHAALRHMTRVSMAGQLSAAITHQLSQPLTATSVNAEAARDMLGHEKIDLAELGEICDDIINESRRATDVIHRLGALYRRSDVKLETLNLNELVRDTLELLRTELLMRHVTAITDLEPTLPLINGGYVQLQQVLLNLAMNAADAMSDSGLEARRLLVQTESRGTDVWLRVVDRGHGIDSAHMKTLYDPFWTTKDGGMGMGLAICQSIVAAHHGTMAASNNPEGGATFCVRLPAASP